MRAWNIDLCPGAGSLAGCQLAPHSNSVLSGSYRLLVWGTIPHVPPGSRRRRTFRYSPSRSGGSALPATQPILSFEGQQADYSYLRRLVSDLPSPRARVARAGGANDLRDQGWNRLFSHRGLSNVDSATGTLSLISANLRVMGR